MNTISSFILCSAGHSAGIPLWSANLLWIMAVVSLFACVYLLVTLFRTPISKMGNIRLSHWFILTWILGFALYDVGMSLECKLFTLITNSPMAFIYAFKIFLLDSEICEIQDAFHHDWLFSANFALIHALAAIVSLMFVIKHFGFNMLSRFKLWIEGHRWLGSTKDETFLIFGINDASRNMIRSINEHYSGEKCNYRIIVVRTNNSNSESTVGHYGIGRILNCLSMRNAEMEMIQENRCFSAGTYANLSDLNLSATESVCNDIVGEKLGLRNIRRILANKTRRKIHVFFLSDDEKDNVHAVGLLRSDKTIYDFAHQENAQEEDEPNVVLYCHARHNSIHQVVEDQSYSEKVRVRVVDSSKISVDMLKSNNDLLPVNFVDVESDGTVSSAFNALVVGFSEVGLDLVRDLYEFGAFVKTGSDKTRVKRSDFHLHVVDKNMSELAGLFVANAPQVNPSIPFVEGKDNEDSLVTLYKMDCRSVEFILKLEEQIAKLNYLAVVTDDDELNISLAVRAFKAALRYRKDMDKFCILVRVRNDEDGHIRRVAEHYNRLLAAENCMSDFKFKTQDTILRTEVINKPICLFGIENELYTYDNIVGNVHDYRAIDFGNLYEKSSRENYEESKHSWKSNFNRWMRLDKGYGEQYNPTMSAVSKLRRSLMQNRANSFHVETKLALVRRALAKMGISSYDWSGLLRNNCSVEYYAASPNQTVDPQIKRLLEVLAQTEHLRWNASHETLGFVSIDNTFDCDEIRLTHGCLTDWENLNDEYRSYDYNVVDVSLGIITPQRPIRTDKSK